VKCHTEINKSIWFWLY